MSAHISDASAPHDQKPEAAFVKSHAASDSLQKTLAHRWLKGGPASTTQAHLWAIVVESPGSGTVSHSV